MNTSAITLYNFLNSQLPAYVSEYKKAAAQAVTTPEPPTDASASGNLHVDAKNIGNPKPLVVGAENAAMASSSTYMYYYNGVRQLFTVPPGVTFVTVTAAGAQGGGSMGGFGGRVTCTVPVTPYMTYDIYVGCQGCGGAGRGTYWYNGGGSTDFRTSGGWIYNRLVVGGGGGGSGVSYGLFTGSTNMPGGGGGGGGFGGNGAGYTTNGGWGASPSSGGLNGYYTMWRGYAAFGFGGDGDSGCMLYNGCGGGGGGYFGGGGGGAQGGGGGGGSSYCSAAAGGTYAGGSIAGSGYLIITVICPAGYYCPSSDGISPVICPQGYYCPAASTSPYLCSAGADCTNAGLSVPPPCPIGSYCPSGLRILCPPGYYCPTTQLMVGIPCPAGTSVSTSGSSVSSQCITCAVGTYSDVGAATCIPCAMSSPTYLASRITYWTGGPLMYQCVCQQLYTGTDCEYLGCPNMLPGTSLGAMLFVSDRQLRLYTTSFNGTAADKVLPVKLYLASLLKTSVDINGDGNITYNEMKDALTYRNVWSSDTKNLPLWCRTASAPLSSAYCYRDQDPTMIDVSKIYNDAMNNYLYSSEHTFDGSGMLLLKKITSSYPRSDWSDDQCNRYNSNTPAFTRVSTAWNWTNSAVVNSIRQVCGYTNGVADVNFKTTDILSGKKTTFTDPRPVTTTDLFKRVYCIYVIFIPAVAGGVSEGYECSVGLFYDGTPIDLQPMLTADGVIFSYLDTSTSETEFDIFAGDLGSPNSLKSLVVGINYPATGCGRLSQHISFADKLSKDKVGVIREYSIRAVQTIGGQVATTSYSTMPYRIPFLVKVDGTVVTKAGVGVKNVQVMFCHVDADLAQNDADVNYCPLQTFVTNTMGQFSGEIRVSNVRWNRLIEYFNVTASLLETLPDGSVITHVFSPDSQVIPMSHSLGTATVTITDNTTVSIFGSVIIDPILINQYVCPFPGVPVNLMTSDGVILTTTTAPDGSFSFPFAVNRGDYGSVFIPPYNNLAWEAREGLISVAGGSGRRLQTDASTGLAPKLKYRWSFGEKFSGAQPIGAKVHDDASNTDAILMNGATVAGGKVSFSFGGGTSPVPYIRLPAISTLSVDRNVTIEAWINFDKSSSALATVFSWGKGLNSVAYVSGTSAQRGSVYLAVVINCRAGVLKEYINGVFIRKIAVSRTVLMNSLSQDPFGYIGRSQDGSGPGLIASLDEFRIWDGELSASTIDSHFCTGSDPTRFSFNARMSLSNMMVTFASVSTQSVSIGMYGGASKRYPMFGGETSVQVDSVDPLCAFSATYRLGNSSSVVRVMAAMNYTVTLLDTSVRAPVFASDACDPTNRLVTNCFCQNTVAPYAYLSSEGELVKNVVIPRVNDSIVYANFTYRTGLCAEIIGMLTFSTADPDIIIQPGQACYPSTVTVLTEGQNVSLKMVLFERYPASASYLWTSGTTLSTANVVVDFTIANAEIVINDVVSGKPSAETFQYNSSIAPSPDLSLLVPVGLNYLIHVDDPIPISPFALPFVVTAYRRGASGKVVSIVTKSWNIPVIGTINKEVPNMYPVASDPTLIYTVLRDPPGGASFATLHAGTNIDFAMSFDGLYAFDEDRNANIGLNVGVEDDIVAIVAPMGFGVEKGIVSFRVGVDSEVNSHRNVKTSRASNTQYRYSMSFSYDISTSTDPFLAGHASDVIVGGGLDLFISEVIIVALSASPPPNLKCLYSYESLTWKPASATTFILPVYEIEQIIKSLSTKVPSADAAMAPVLTKQISNWKKVLSDYRAYHTNGQSIFTAENLAFVDMVNAYSKWKSNVISDGEFTDIVKNTHPKTGQMFNTALGNSFTRVQQVCDNVIPSYSNTFVTDICGDFDPQKWTRFASGIQGFCNMPLVGSDGRMSAVANSPAVKEMCKQKQIARETGLPGAGTIDDQSMFGFLKDSSKFLTFGAGSPLTISWTSTVTDSLTTNINLDLTNSLDFSVGAEGKVSATVFAEFMGKYGQGSGIEVTLGRSADSSHVFERTVSVTFEDNDNGDYFAVRVTQDPVFATPIFTTMGGKSKCPGETGTTRRESGVKIFRIIDRCCNVNTSPGSCLCRDLPGGSPATFGIVLLNLSPSGDDVSYTLKHTKSFDTYYGDTYQCGRSGQRAGLLSDFMETELNNIPYNQLVEIPIGFGGGDNGNNFKDLCLEFNDIELQVVATCEIPSSGTEVYQYGIKAGVISYAPENRLYASNDTATFSVTWMDSGSRRALKSVTDAHSSDVTDTKQDIKVELDAHKGGMTTELETMKKRIGEEIVDMGAEISAGMQREMQEHVAGLKEDMAGLKENMAGMKEELIASMEETIKRLVLQLSSAKKDSNN